MDNYGQLLQGFALQHFLRGRGHDAYIVQYKPSYEVSIVQSTWIEKIKRIKNVFHPIKYIRARIEMENEARYKKNNKVNNKLRCFDDFRNRHIRMSNKIYTSISELRDNPPRADVYICGSDQVWHDTLVSANVAGWYLQFGEKCTKRISYAPSIGREITQAEELQFKQYLSTFDALSLRERAACDYCIELGFKNARWVCDPTFLLSAEYYKSICKIEEYVDNPYVFFYTLNIQKKDELLWENLKPIIEEKDWEIKSVGSSGYIPARNVVPGSENIYATIEQWLQLINNSSLVVSTSFHAIAFSVILHRPFVAIPLQGKHAKANERIVSLLDSLGIGSRFCRRGEDLKKIINTEINWDLVDKKLNELKKDSISFLVEAGL